MAKPIPALQYLRKPEDVPAAPVYAVFGDEDYLRRRALDLLCEQLRKRKLEIRRVRELEAVAPLLDELRSPNLFGGAFAVVLTNKREGNRQEPSAKFKEEFAAYLEHPGKRNVLVFEGVTWARNLLVPKRLEDRYPAIQAEAFKPWETGEWDNVLAMQAKELGLTLDHAATLALREAVGANLSRAEQELRKLALLVKDGRVTANDIARAVGYEGVDVTFPLCDALITGDTKLTLKLAAQLAVRAETGSVLQLFGLLRMQVATLGRVALLVKRGVPSGAAVSQAAPRMRDAVRGKLGKTAEMLDRVNVARAVDVLMRADEAMKSTSPDPAVLLLTVMHSLCEHLHLQKRALAPGAR